MERGERVKESVWRTLANINSLCKSAAQTNWQAGITPERSWIKSMKALAPLTLDLQPRPVHRSVLVMHTNDSEGAGRTVTSQHIGFLTAVAANEPVHPPSTSTSVERKTHSPEVDAHTAYVCVSWDSKACSLVSMLHIHNHLATTCWRLLCDGTTWKKQGSSMNHGDWV